MERKIRVLTALTAAALLVSICLWGLSLLPAPPFSPVWPGLACSVLAAGLLTALISAQRRHTAQRREEHRQELEAERDAHAQALEQALAQAHRENQQEMDAFRSGLAHTLRMPVAIIQGYVDLLTSGVVTDPATQEEYLAKISDRSQYLTEAISRQFATRETPDANHLNYAEIDLIALIRQAAADMQTAAENHGVSIHVISTEPCLTIQADSYLINRVFFNLLENALKYMGRPGIITICVLRDGDNVSIRVQDDGMGLASDETAHIFESSFQGSNHTQGQGFGLYLVKCAVEKHGGTVSAQSAPGQGMSITMLLPTAPAPQA